MRTKEKGDSVLCAPSKQVCMPTDRSQRTLRSWQASILRDTTTLRQRYSRTDRRHGLLHAITARRGSKPAFKSVASKSLSQLYISQQIYSKILCFLRPKVSSLNYLPVNHQEPKISALRSAWKKSTDPNSLCVYLAGQHPI